jgi:dUTP pyrophosphatase
MYQIGERAAQIIIMPYPKIFMVESDELSETVRGTGGFGSTGF